MRAGDHYVRDDAWADDATTTAEQIIVLLVVADYILLS